MTDNDNNKNSYNDQKKRQQHKCFENRNCCDCCEKIIINNMSLPNPPLPRQGNGTFIPFASGAPGRLVGSLRSQDNIIVGFGNNFIKVTGKINDSIILNDMTMAFAMPNSGIITGMSIYLTNSAPISIGNTSSELIARLYKATSAESNIFNPINNSSVIIANLPPQKFETGILQVFGSRASDLNITVSQFDRIIMVITDVKNTNFMFDIFNVLIDAGITIFFDPIIIEAA